jgi:hypothetical protein
MIQSFFLRLPTKTLKAIQNNNAIISFFKIDSFLFMIKSLIIDKYFCPKEDK